MNKEKFFKLFWQFFKFGLVGVSNTAISYGTYAFLTYVGCPYVCSNIIAFIVSVLNSFFWNNRYVFKKEEGEKRNPWWTLAKTFMAYGSTGLILSNVLLVFLVEKLNMNKYVAPLLILLITIPLNFLINKFWAFRTKKTGTKKSEETDIAKSMDVEKKEIQENV